MCLFSIHFRFMYCLCHGFVLNPFLFNARFWFRVHFESVFLFYVQSRSPFRFESMFLFCVQCLRMLLPCIFLVCKKSLVFLDTWGDVIGLHLCFIVCSWKRDSVSNPGCGCAIDAVLPCKQGFGSRWCSRHTVAYSFVNAPWNLWRSPDSSSPTPVGSQAYIQLKDNAPRDAI